MPLPARLVAMFPPTVRRRARALLSAGAVTLVRIADEEVEASVNDDGLHAVRATVPEGENPTLACSCDEWTRRGSCAHLWATLVEADRAGLPSLRDRRPVTRSPVAATFPLDWAGRIAALRDELDAAARRGELPGPQSVRLDVQVLYVIDRVRTQRGGGLALNAFVRRRLRSGRWGTTRGLGSAERDGALPLPEADESLLASLRGASAYRDPSAHVDSFVLPQPLATTLLPALCETGRCLLEEPRGDDLVPLLWDAGEPWRFVLDTREIEGVWQGRGRLAREGRDIPLDHADLLVPEGIVVVDGVAARLETHGATALLRSLRDEGALTAPAADASALVGALLELPALPELRLDGATLPTAPPPTPQLDLAEAPGTAGTIAGRVSFRYGEVEVPSSDGATVLPGDGGAARRDLASETRWVAELLADPAVRVEDGAERGELSFSAVTASALLERLLARGWAVTVAGHRRRAAGPLTGSVSSGIDWFDLRGELAFDDQSVALPELLRAVRQGAAVVALPDGSEGVLPADLLRRLALLGTLGTAEGDGVRFGRHQGWLLDALVTGEAHVGADDGFAHFREEVRSFDGIQPESEPETFQGELRQYQREGLAWFGFLRRFGCGGCLADDMGLGKTVQVLALLEARRTDGENHPPSLVVAPRSVVFNWLDEAARFTPKLRVLDYSGASRRSQLPDLGDHDLVVTTYGVLRRDGEQLSKLELDYAILDESQAVKNPATQVARAARLLRARHRLALSGTPIENHLEELWSLFEYLNPGMLGRSSAFRRLITRRGTEATDSEGRALLARALRPFLLRRTKEQVAQDLPPKTEQTLHCDMTPRQKRSYRDLARHYRQALVGGGQRVKDGKLKPRGSQLHVLEALLRLRQAACHPGLVDVTRQDEPSGKLEALIPLLQEVAEEGHKALVFSQFTSFLALVRKELDRVGLVHEYLDGSTRDRKSCVDRFQTDPDCPLFVISLKAGGLGLNLTAADYVFILDPWWNPAAEAQAIDRTYRIGQTRRVMAYRLVSRDTVEERVLELQDRKRALVAELLTEDNALLRNLTSDDLALLLR